MQVIVVFSKFPTLSETFIYSQVQALADLGNDLRVIVKNRLPGPFAHRGFFTFAGVQVDAINDGRRVAKVRNWPRMGWRCLKLGFLGPVTESLMRRRPGQAVFCVQVADTMGARQAPADVVHIHSGTNGALFAPLVRKMGKKAFCTFHGYDLRRGKREGGQIYSDVWQAFDGIIAISDFSVTRLCEMGCPDRKIHRINNGVDVDRITRAGGGMQQGETPDLKLISVARLHEVKGLQYAIKAVAQIRKGLNGREIQYEIVGSGEELENLRALCSELGVDHIVTFAGALPLGQVYAAMCRSDVLILSSLAENLPTVLLECRACGAVPVATDVGGVSEIVHSGVDGILVPPRDPTSIARGLSRLAADPGLLSSMRSRGLEFVRGEYSIGAVARNLMQLYRE